MVKLKKKVTLKTKVTESSITPESTNVSGESRPNKGKKWFLLIALVIVAIVAFLLLKPEDTNDTDSVVKSEEATESLDQQENALKQDTIQVDSESISNKEDGKVLANDNSISDGMNAGDVKSNLPEEKEKVNVVTQNNTQSSSQTTISVEKSKEEVVLSGSIDEKAIMVIRGDFGNGEERKNKLGSEYTVIQNRVNEMYDLGLVY